MPELPEVETIKRDLKEKVVGKTIKEIEIVAPQLVKKPTLQQFILGLVGETITILERRGKYLLFSLASGKILVIHLRMTGQLVYCSVDTPMEKHLCLIFSLFDKEKNQNMHLRYMDIRRFGFFALLEPGEKLSGLEKLGPEPFSSDFTVEYLGKCLLKRNVKIKTLLLDQSIVAGIGNIYADETLFRAGIHPERVGSSLTKEEIAKLHHFIPQVLKESIEKRGTTFSDYRDGLGKKGGFQNHLQVYGQAGEECPNCGNIIEKIKISGRSSCFCPYCQG